MPSAIAEKIRSYEKQADRFLGRYPFVLQVERQTGVNKVHGVVLVMIALLVVAAYRLAPGAVAALALYAYPAYHTAAAIDRKSPLQDSQQQHWLSYWLAIATLKFLEAAVTAAWLERRVPLYGVLRIAFAVWMFAPRFRGSLLVFERGLRPAFQQVALLVDLVQSTVSCGGSGSSAAAAASKFGPSVAATKLGLAKAAAAASAAITKPAPSNKANSSEEIGSKGASASSVSGAGSSGSPLPASAEGSTQAHD